MDYLKAPYTPQNSATNLVIGSIETPFSFSNIDPNYTSVKNITQSKSSHYFTENSIGFEGTYLMSSFYNRSLKICSIQYTSTH